MRTALALVTLLEFCVAGPVFARADVAAADTAVRAFMAQEGIPMAHVTMTRGDEVILQRGFTSAGTGPPPDAASIFPLGSISKQFTAATVLALVDAGKVRLDASVGEYLPEWFADEPALHVSHLLAQTSGVADFLWLEGYRPLAEDPATPVAAYVALAAGAPRRFAPGTRWAYSNTNYKALALIVERVTGRPFDSVLADLVLRPAGLDGIMPCHSLRPDQFVPGVSAEGRQSPLDPSAAAYVGDGGLCGTAAALVKWIRFGLVPGNARISRLAVPGRLADGTQVPYGFGLSIREFLGHSMVWHGGNVDSHSSMIAYLPEQDLGLVILTSRGFLWLTELMPALLGVAPPARAIASGSPPAGRFEDGLFRYALTADGDTLRVEIDLIGPLDFIPAGPREYIAEKYPATFRIRMPADGSRDRFELDWGEVRSFARRAADSD